MSLSMQPSTPLSDDPPAGTLLSADPPASFDDWTEQWVTHFLSARLGFVVRAQRHSVRMAVPVEGRPHFVTSDAVGAAANCELPTSVRFDRIVSAVLPGATANDPPRAIIALTWTELYARCLEVVAQETLDALSKPVTKPWDGLRKFAEMIPPATLTYSGTSADSLTTSAATGTSATLVGNLTTY